MKNLELPGFRFTRRVNRRIQVLLTNWLDTLAAPFLGLPAVRGAMPAQYPPERQDLYGFAASDVLVSRHRTS